MSAIPEILRKHDYAIHVREWRTPLPFPGNPFRSTIAVAKKMNDGMVKQILNIGVCNNQIRFYATNGHKEPNLRISYSTFLQDEDEHKFIQDLKRFIQEAKVRVSLRKPISEFSLRIIPYSPPKRRV